jgi:hypothetical protein
MRVGFYTVTAAVVCEKRAVEIMETLDEALPREIERCQELLIQYAAIGPAGAFGTAVIKVQIAEAHKAMATQDVVAMIKSLKALKECQ